MSAAEILNGFCRVHRQLAWNWLINEYDRHNPCDWPGGLKTQRGVGVMDSRTAHAARAAEFERKNRAQAELIAKICRSGCSPQCVTDGAS